MLIDERLGRQAAKDLDIKIAGILGILLLAKGQNLIEVVKPIMDNLISQAHFQVSSQLYADVLKTADESSDLSHSNFHLRSQIQVSQEKMKPRNINPANSFVIAIAQRFSMYTYKH